MNKYKLSKKKQFEHIIGEEFVNKIVDDDEIMRIVKHEWFYEIEFGYEYAGEWLYNIITDLYANNEAFFDAGDFNYKITGDELSCKRLAYEIFGLIIDELNEV